MAATLLPLAAAQSPGPTSTARPAVFVEPTAVEVRAGGAVNVTAVLANPTAAPITWALGFSARDDTKLSFERWEVHVPAGERARVNATVKVGNATGEFAAFVLAKETEASARAAGRTTRADVKAELQVRVLAGPAVKPPPRQPTATATFDTPENVPEPGSVEPPAPQPAALSATQGILLLTGVGVAGVGAAAWATRRDWWPFVAAPLAALYTRLRPSKLLDHPLRAKLVSIVAAQPGITFGDLARALDVAPGQLTHHARMLEKGRILCSSPDGQSRRFYLVAQGRVAPVAPVAERALALVRASPRRASDLARELGVSRQALHYHLKQLTARGELVARQEGRDLWLEAPPGPQSPSAPRGVART